MNVETCYLVLNPDVSVTPLNLNGWLRKQLLAQAWDEDDEIMVFLFVTETFIGTLGRKKFDKLVGKASGKHEWIGELRVMPVKALISDEEAKAQVSAEFSKRAGTAMDGLESTFLGYDSDSAADRFLESKDVEPVCVVRQITAYDIQNINEEYPDLKQDQWMVIAMVDEKLVISPAIAAIEDAMEYAKTTYGAVRFLTMPIGN